MFAQRIWDVEKFETYNGDVIRSFVGATLSVVDTPNESDVDDCVIGTRL